MIDDQDPYDAAIAAVLPEEPQRDEYDIAIEAAMGLPEPGVADYAKAGVRGLMESVAGPLRGAGGMADALRRAVPALDIGFGEGPSAFTAGAEAIRSVEPEVNPRAEATLPGRLAEGAGNVLGMVGQSVVAPGGALYAAGAMGAQEFGRGQERALAAGASPEEADLAGVLDFPAGAAQAIPVGRAVTAFKVLERARDLLGRSALASGAKEGALNVGLGAGATAWTGAIHNAITGQEDVDAIVEAVKEGAIPDALIGFALGGAMRWSASRAGPLSPEGVASIDEAANEAANTLRTAKGAESALETPGEPIRGADGEDVANPEAPRPTRIEVPDDDLAAATGRFAKSIKRASPLELHEADPAAQERAAGIGMRLVEVDGGDALPAAGYYDRESRTAFIDRRAGDAARKAALLEHETVHFMEREHPTLAARWTEELTKADPAWQQEAGKARRARQKAEGLPGLSEAAGREEARAEAAEGLSGVLDLLDQAPDLIARVADYQPGLIRTLIDASIDLANRLGLTKRTSVAQKVAQLDSLLKESGTDFEKRLGAQKAAKLAKTLRDLHRAMRVEEPTAQPKANERPSPYLEPKPSDEVQGPPKPAPPTRAELVEGLPAGRAAEALGALDQRIEDALVRGEGLETPRLKELAKDRAAAQKLLYEAEPDHPLLGREDPITVWKRIEREDQESVATARKQREQAAKATEKSGMQRSKAVQAAERKLDRDLAKLEKDATRRQRETMAKKAAEEREFRKLVAEEERAKKKAEPKPKAEKKPTKKEVDEKVEAELRKSKDPLLGPARFVEKKQAEPALAVPTEPAKPAIPLKRRERVAREELKDQHVRSILEGMAKTAEWDTEGGKAVLPKNARNAEGHRGTSRWIPKAPWLSEVPDEVKLSAKDARKALEDALGGWPLGAKQRAFVEWAIDRADGELYQGATGEQRAEARRAYDEMATPKPPAEPDSDVPFALPLRRKEPQDPSDAERERALEFARTHGIVPALGPGSHPLRNVRDRALWRLWVEQERVLKEAEFAQLPEYTPRTEPDERSKAFAAEQRNAKGWLDAFRAGLAAGKSEAEAARSANAMHPEALRPMRFPAGFGDAAFALHEKPRGGAGLREFLRRYGDEDPHYAVTSKGGVTRAARAAAEQFWEKETRTKGQMQRAAREMLASKAGKAEVDAAIRGERQGDWREQSDLTVAAEMRVNAKLRAAATSGQGGESAIDLAVDYYMLRSEQGRALSSVQRPRDARESFYNEAAKPSPEHAEELSSIVKQMRDADPVQRRKLRARIDAIKKAEAKRFEAGMLALQKAGIDIETMPNTSLAAAHAYRIFALATNRGLWDPILEMRASAMVSHPASSIAALGGNVLNVGWNTVLMRLAELPVPDGASVGEMKAIASALPGAWNKAWNALKNVVLTDTPSYEAQLQDLGKIQSAQAFENAKLASIPGKAGRAVRGIGLTPMTAVDEFARALGTELEAVAIAYRRAKGDKARMTELLDTSAVWEEAVKRTRRSIFQQRDDNPIVELGFKAREGLDAATGNTIPAGHLIFPFVQTGVNALLEGLRKIPGPAQVASIARLRKGGWRDPEIRAQETARLILSTAIAGAAWGMANARDEEGRPYLTGTETDSNDPPLSWQSGDGKWRSYSKMMPFSTVLAFLVDAARSGVDPVAMGHSLLKQGVDQTYFNSMAGILAAIESDAAPDAKLKRAGRDFAASFIPNIARGALTAANDAQTVDPLRRHENDDFGVWDSLKLRAGLGEPEERIDNFGRPIAKGGSGIDRYLNPMPPNRDLSDEHAADKVIRAWNLALPEGEKPWVPQRPRYWYEVKNETRYMTDPQYARFQRRAGELAATYLDESTLDPQNPTKAQIDRIKRALSRARRVAKREVLRDIPYEEDDE